MMPSEERGEQMLYFFKLDGGYSVLSCVVFMSFYILIIP